MAFSFSAIDTSEVHSSFEIQVSSFEISRSDSAIIASVLIWLIPVCFFQLTIELEQPVYSFFDFYLAWFRAIEKPICSSVLIDFPISCARVNGYKISCIPFSSVTFLNHGILQSKDTKSVVFLFLYFLLNQ